MADDPEPVAGADDDADVPSPPGPPEARTAPHAAAEQHPGLRFPTGSDGQGGTPGLERFLWLHPCSAFFAHLAHQQGTASTPAMRFQDLRSRDQRFYWVCVIFDLGLTMAASLALLGLAGFVVWVSVVAPHL